MKINIYITKSYLVLIILPFLKAVKNESGHYGTELYTEIATRIIETHNKSEPLYLYLAQQGVHSANGNDPLQAPQRLLDVSQNRPWAIYF